MKIFVTGASGHIGTVVVPELINNGHQVIGLARSDEAAEQLEKAGAEVRRGTLDDHDVLAAAAKESDGVIHLAFKHDIAFTGNMPQAAQDDYKALEIFGEALAGTGKPLVGVGGTLMLAMANLGRTGLESDTLESGPRTDSENLVIGFAEKNIRSSVIRLAPTVHGPLDNNSGFIPTIIKIAHDSGFSGYVEDGANHWPAIHELDAAVLFRLALEKAPAGSRLHGVGDEAIAFKDIASAIGQKLDLPTKSVPIDESDQHFAPLGRFVALDGPASNAATRELLNWQPTHPGLIDDLKNGDYFKNY